MARDDAHAQYYEYRMFFHQGTIYKCDGHWNHAEEADPISVKKTGHFPPILEISGGAFQTKGAPFSLEFSGFLYHAFDLHNKDPDSKTMVISCPNLFFRSSPLIGVEHEDGSKTDLEIRSSFTFGWNRDIHRSHDKNPRPLASVKKMLTGHRLIIYEKVSDEELMALLTYLVGINDTSQHRSYANVLINVLIC